MSEATPETISTLCEQWMRNLEVALSVGDKDALGQLFLEDSYWRDLAALTWDVRQYWGRDEVVPHLLTYAANAQPRNFALAPDRTPPRILPDGVTADFVFHFETSVGAGNALVIAALDNAAPHGFRARLITTALTDLTCHPVAPASRRGFVQQRPGETWAQYRVRTHDLDEREPEVLVLGGGQSGVIMGARLDRLGVPYVIIDDHKRPGDGWRERYSSLALHTPTYVNDLPYVRQPETFPAFLSKDQWGNYLDAYADLMNLNWWGETQFLQGAFDEAERHWNIDLRLKDGTVRTLHPKHLVTALGYTGTEPRIPDFPGLADFSGSVSHSSQFKTGADYAGKRVLVVGAATSGHDIAYDLAEHGATTYMGQRGAVCVVPIDEAERFNVDYLQGQMSVDEIDERRNGAFVFPLMLKRAQAETERTEREYADMFEGLRKAGLELTIGDEKAGWIYRLHRTISGYYLDVGASQAIIDGRIKIVRMADVETFLPQGVRLQDGTVIELDAVVLATGYQNVSLTIERLLGTEIARKVGAIGGVADDGEHRNLARPTGQPHLWMLFGGIMDARKMSKVLALQIIAQLEGVAPTLVRTPDGDLQALEEPALLAGGATS